MIFGRRKIGFVVDNPLPYNEAMASTRLRCYDIIKQLKRGSLFKASLFDEHRDYDLVVFQKCFGPEHLELAGKLKKKGVRLVLDINVNYLDVEEGVSFVNEEHRANLFKMLEISDAVLTASPWLEQRYKKAHDNVFCIEEAVTEEFFRVNKRHREESEIKIVYCGYSAKATEVFLIKDVLLELKEKYNISMLYISEKDPAIDVLPYEFVPYNHKLLPELLTKGDMKIAPRDLSKSYNLGHTMTKISYPMATGLPVVASPVPSYINRGAVICESEAEWKSELGRLISSAEMRNLAGQKGRETVKGMLSSQIIGNQYEALFNYISGSSCS